jgi:hypothetical protein
MGSARFKGSRIRGSEDSSVYIWMVLLSFGVFHLTPWTLDPSTPEMTIHEIELRDLNSIYNETIE